MNFSLKKIKPEIGYYLAGFADAEACFCVSFSPKKNKENTIISWRVRPAFSISQKERHIIAQFKKHLQCGTVYTNKKTQVSQYCVTHLPSLRNSIIPFFQKFHFQSAKKKKDFSNFVQVLDILEKNPFLNKKNIEQILALRVNTEAIIANRIYTDKSILLPFCESNNIEQIKKSSETTMPNSETTKKSWNEMIESDLYGDIKAENALKFYIAGFADGDGSFHVSFRKRDDYRIGWKISPSFSIAQRDEILLRLFQKTIGCGTIQKGSSSGLFFLHVGDLNDLRTKIVSFFTKYPLLSEVGKDRFQKFCQTLDILNNVPLSRSHVEKILLIIRDKNTKTRYSPDAILARVDEFSIRKQSL